ncbi:hypothetical protein [Streptomyces fructofermentans]|uniref:hypothetical protein n=1 Tax=Streptomyces fructofermentans TaxID=152141 RepID=UPI0016751177
MAVRFRVPGFSGRAPGPVRGLRPGADLEGRVCSELSADLPDEDLGEYLYDCIDLYRMGSKPRCEEVEFLGLVQDAIDEMERGR